MSKESDHKCAELILDKNILSNDFLKKAKPAQFANKEYYRLCEESLPELRRELAEYAEAWTHAGEIYVR